MALGDGKYFEPSYEKEEPNVLKDYYSSGISAFFCVKPETTFRRSSSDIKDHQQCPEGYELQFFNLYASVRSMGNFTLTLK